MFVWWYPDTVVGFDLQKSFSKHSSSNRCLEAANICSFLEFTKYLCRYYVFLLLSATISMFVRTRLSLRTCLVVLHWSGEIKRHKCYHVRSSKSTLSSKVNSTSSTTVWVDCSYNILNTFQGTERYAIDVKTQIQYEQTDCSIVKVLRGFVCLRTSLWTAATNFLLVLLISFSLLICLRHNMAQYCWLQRVPFSRKQHLSRLAV